MMEGTLLLVLAVRAIGEGVSSRHPESGFDGGAPPGHVQPRGLLDERYARGELTTEEQAVFGALMTFSRTSAPADPPPDSDSL